MTSDAQGLGRVVEKLLATRWVSIDTQFSREPRIVLEFKGAEALSEPMDISFLGYVFPVSEAQLMRRRLEAERQ